LQAFLILYPLPLPTSNLDSTPAPVSDRVYFPAPNSTLDTLTRTGNSPPTYTLNLDEAVDPKSTNNSFLLDGGVNK